MASAVRGALSAPTRVPSVTWPLATVNGSVWFVVVAPTRTEHCSEAETPCIQVVTSPTRFGCANPPVSPGSQRMMRVLDGVWTISTREVLLAGDRELESDSARGIDPSVIEPTTLETPNVV